MGWWADRQQRKHKQSLQRRYEALLKEARDLQRGGDIPAFAAKTAEANKVLDELDALPE